MDQGEDQIAVKVIYQDKSDQKQTEEFSMDPGLTVHELGIELLDKIGESEAKCTLMHLVGVHEDAADSYHTVMESTPLSELGEGDLVFKAKLTFGFDPENPMLPLWKTWLTLKQMCKDRGYDVTQEMVEKSFEAFMLDFEEGSTWEALNFVVEKQQGEGTEKLLVYFPPGPADDLASEPFSSNDLASLLKMASTNNCARAILVLRGKLTSITKRTIQEAKIQEPPLLIEVFHYTKLLYNITRHHTVPKHEVLTPEEKIQLLQRYNISEHNLPRMQANDPIAQYFGLAEGEVVRIVRPSETAGTYVSYRVVHDLLS
eukprot:m.284555 g.284555  ORF g.284555 m.284555 type:complete len:315 (+) comp15765_c1_seq1:227-1171(+)